MFAWARTCRGTLGHPSRPTYFCRGCAHACRPSQRHKLGSTCAATRALQACNSAVVSGAKWGCWVAHHQWLHGTFLVPAEPLKPICLPHNQRSVRPSPSLTSTTPHIAAKVGSGVSECPLGQRTSSGYGGGSVRVIHWAQATAEAKDGTCNAPVAAPSTIAFSTCTKTWVLFAPRRE